MAPCFPERSRSRRGQVGRAVASGPRGPTFTGITGYREHSWWRGDSSGRRPLARGWRRVSDAWRRRRGAEGFPPGQAGGAQRLGHGPALPRLAHPRARLTRETGDAPVCPAPPHAAGDSPDRRHLARSDTGAKGAEWSDRDVRREAGRYVTLISPLRPSVRPLLRPVATMATTASRCFLMVVAAFLTTCDDVPARNRQLRDGRVRLPPAAVLVTCDASTDKLPATSWSARSSCG